MIGVVGGEMCHVFDVFNVFGVFDFVGLFQKKNDTIYLMCLVC